MKKQAASNPDPSDRNMTYSIFGGVWQFDPAHYNQCIHRWHSEVMIDGSMDLDERNFHLRIDARLDPSDQMSDFNLHFELIRGRISCAALIAGVLIRNWSGEHYLLLPGAAYNGNRFESRKIGYSPKLLEEKDIGKDRPIIISDVPRLNVHPGPSMLQDRSGSLTENLIGIFDPFRLKSLFIRFPLKTSQGDTGIFITENNYRDELRIFLKVPVVRELTRYYITDNTYPSEDKPVELNKGYHEDIRLSIQELDAASPGDLFTHHISHVIKREHRNDLPGIFPLSNCFEVLERKFNSMNWVEEHGYYSVGMRENFLQDWQIGWTGGMISTYPLLAKGSEETQKRVLRNFDWLFNGGLCPSGFFWDSGEKGTRWYGGDIRRTRTRNWHLIRKSGDALYYIIKQFQVMENKGIEPAEKWIRDTKRVGDAFVQLWNENGQFGQFIDSNSGRIIVGGSTSGAIVPAALVLACNYYNKEKYLDVAIEAAGHYYGNYVSRGITCGGPGDALQCSDSESAYAMLESFVCLYEVTGDRLWLDRSEEMARQFATWIMNYDYSFPAGTLMHELKIKTRGAVMANVQNKHASPGICTHSGQALLRLSRYTGNLDYARLLQLIVRNIPQYLSHPGRPIPGMKEGWISERINTTDWFEGIGEIMYGSTWAETALMLSYIEIPGIYLTGDFSDCIVFDQLDMERSGENPEKTIRINNTTQYDAITSIMADKEPAGGEPMQTGFLSRLPSRKIAAGESILLNLKDLTE